MEPCKPSATQLKLGADVEPCEPLWKRAPTRDPEGRPLSDFMMIIPRLGKRPTTEMRERLDAIQAVLHRYRSVVVFADVNLRLSTLWVTVRPVPGICLELSAAVKMQVPEALLVAQKHR